MTVMVTPALYCVFTYSADVWGVRPCRLVNSSPYFLKQANVLLIFTER